ncbi:dUTP diphosphatase [Halodesulfovibrio spirochaetisodalis]|uniref:dUTP diphosphatase n=1 Tax=Halodesulfovibrio spirochaetisodalis TaxID=1560234 RepID=A0A1B7XCG2_9BACT|nr:dUTP diphosphatase [Halodesulfovibrio spirochaetisodalis]OBQ51621.1 deoxyuridine 5'-triphosphate nucleotidohydrolase [Halodesulfovibrio spirochaetisodalis]
MSLQVNVRFVRDAAAELYGADAHGVSGLAYATPSSAGLDLRACFEEDEVMIPAGGRYAVPAGIAIDPQSDCVAGFLYSRSGLGTKRGLTVSQGVGVVDPDYRGEIFISLLNTSGEDRVITRGERVAQLVFQPFFRAQIAVVDSLEESERGEGGFGHTGTM